MRASGMFPIAWFIVAIFAARSAYCSHETLAPNAYLFETFDSNDWSSRWVHSEDEKYQGKFTTSLIKTVMIETVAVESSNAVLKVQSLKRRNKSKRFCKIFIFTRSDSGHACTRGPDPQARTVLWNHSAIEQAPGSL